MNIIKKSPLIINLNFKIEISAVFIYFLNKNNNWLLFKLLFRESKTVFFINTEYVPNDSFLQSHEQHRKGE